ncbi:hypothetical protein H0G69_10565 (plasmid) [Limosilactobacillus mucosae]|uniref:hypothetical protein n=1 Tax=Limosilactobacillus mucosae TaxID=97478 RepID=UPI0015D5331C|nr:hypothetical protein [Limosilactobacillus mucosae]QLI95442.1 hypothetical protein H0G69_10565 [Limosilactobacillus mucosae]
MISIRTEADKAYISSPYNPEFVKEIHSIGSAKWHAATKEWQVPVESLEDAKQVLRDVYGTDGSENNEPKVTVKLTIDDDVDLGDIQSIDNELVMTLFGREIMSARGRDSGVKVADGVTVKGKYKSGGSMKYPTIEFGKGTEIIVYNVPESLAKKTKVKHATVEVVSKPKIDRQALLDEKSDY